MYALGIEEVSRYFFFQVPHPSHLRLKPCQGQQLITDFKDTDLFLHIVFALFCLQSLPHAKGNATLVQCLISCDSHAYLVSDSQ